MLNLKQLWTCPLCAMQHQTAVIRCKRCDCHLLLLNKAKLFGWTFAQQGKDLESAAMLCQEQLLNLLAPLPSQWYIGPGFLMYPSPEKAD